MKNIFLWCFIVESVCKGDSEHKNSCKINAGEEELKGKLRERWKRGKVGAPPVGGSELLGKIRSMKQL